MAVLQSNLFVASFGKRHSCADAKVQFQQNQRKTFYFLIQTNFCLKIFRQNSFNNLWYIYVCD